MNIFKTCSGLHYFLNINDIFYACGLCIELLPLGWEIHEHFLGSRFSGVQCLRRGGISVES